MAASYPTSVKSFSTKSTTDVVEAAHPNDLQDEVTAIETDLLTAFPGGGADGGQMKFPATQNPSSDANTLDDYEEGTFTGTLTGVSGSVTVTVRYTKIGNKVQLDVPTLSGTSNATTKTLTGMSAALIPARAKNQVIGASDNGGAIVPSICTLSALGVITFYATIATSVNWTASGTAEIVAFQMSYTLA
jgi:hypothetical protein